MEILTHLKAGADFLFQLDTMIYMIVGVALGIIAGALPGFTSTNANAVMLPFTLAMPVECALVFIASVYCGAMYGDAVPAVLFNTPGSAGAAATALDGYPMSLQGKADQALGISTGASLWGGVIAGIVVILVIRPMSMLALRFGPAEMFLLAFLGISVISSISTKNMTKGILSGLFGLLLAAVAADPMWGRPRMNFGMIELYDTVPFIPVLIGLFALPTLIELTQRYKIADINEGAMVNVGSFRRLWEGVMETVKRPIAVIRSSLIGCFIGAIPGTGASIATFVSYGQAKAWSKTPELFGKGNPDGVIASEAANNAVTGGSMVPTLALGIPGSGTTAVMLAALILHGIRPGPHVIREFPGETYALLLSLLIAPIVMVPLALVFNRYSSKITTFRTAFIVPVLICLCLVGAYAIRLYQFDFYVVLLFGLLGMLMIRTGYPTVPFVLGVILGPIAEGNVVRAIKISRGDLGIFFSSTVCYILWAAIMFVLLSPLVVSWIKDRAEKKAAASAS